ncbi:helix-turn-helix domain-containing protein [Rubellimicrobium sp. CFH 75288]|uniref:helix-turn-helix domain-containing protein n=1 Tax=Rubellimicrobium sp. CFH 75288 TaxID=2697034 RepID=UPI00141248EE|nr:helix-turn-helix transcriptional regulator [Rubellimicrobium sp. CFH 75288]NAZ37206.1 helix-turn-helix domain-containing protein [Rubellimicrobium sp. CFH 75288]
MDKRTRSSLFRQRLATAMEQRGLTQAALARAVGVDRSTVSQLLSGDLPRLPNVHVAAGAAEALGVSADWLLGLSDRQEPAAELVAAAMTMTEAPRSLVDETIFGWHREAAGYKIRIVPAHLPDMLKTRDLLQWESEPVHGRTAEQAIGASEDRLAWMRGGHSDYEIALPLHELATFAHGQGLYRDLPRDMRREQIAHMIVLHEQLYPTLRVHLFDARRLYSAPITVFGPLLAVLYLGRNYLAFRDRGRVETLTRHFDALVREAAVPSRDLPAHLSALAAEAGL